MLYDDLPRMRLAHLPTPIEELARLTDFLGGPRLFIKRDDCTGLASGGNKTRKLEFLVADAAARGADALITEGGVQSNHCRQTAAAALKAGMTCMLVLSPGYADEDTGNLLLDRLLGARIMRVESTGARAGAMRDAADSLARAGRHPYIIPTGGSNGLGAIGYASCMREIKDQSEALGFEFDAIVSASGSGGTQGGLVLGAKLLDSMTRIIGISDGEPREALAERVREVALEGAQVLGSELALADDDIIVYDEYYGEGYGVPSPQMVEAVRLLARKEAILLDPVYTGKAMAGLIDLVRKEVFEANQNVLFIHTGGTPALFAYRESFAERWR